MGIVQVSFFFIVKDIVGFLHGLEPDLRGFSFGLGDLIGVTSKSGLGSFEYQILGCPSPTSVGILVYLAISLPNIVFACAAGDL